MKIKIMKKAGVFLMAVAMVFVTAASVHAVAYYDVGGMTALRLVDVGGVLQIRFGGAVNDVTGPAGDFLANPMNGYQQAITGTYTLQNIGGGIYNLIGGPSTITVTDGGPAVLQATATATQINFNNHTISWGAVNMGAIDVGIGSQSLIDLAANNASYAFTNFSFDAIANENQWLTGGSPNTNTPTVYRSRLEGFAAAPEPAEWMLMFIGLGMLGFYLQRRGYLTFDLSPQSAA